MPIQLVVFDMAGTTVADKNYVGTAFQGAMNDFGYKLALDKINQVMGFEKLTAIRMMLKEHVKEITDQLVKDIHGKFVRQMIHFYETSKEIAPLPNVEKTFEELRVRGIKVALDTGFSRKIADVIVRRFGWEDKIDFLVASDEVPNGRPGTDMIDKIKTALGIESSTSVAKVGDTGADIQEGINSGCKYVIGITTGTLTREALAKYNPTHIVDDISEVIGIVTASEVIGLVRIYKSNVNLRSHLA